MMANLEVADEAAKRVLGHSLGGLMATYNVSRHRKQKWRPSWRWEAELLRLISKDGHQLCGNVVPLRLAS